MVNLALAFVSFIVFSVWPSAGGAIYGWLFKLFTELGIDDRRHTL